MLIVSIWFSLSLFHFFLLTILLLPIAVVSASFVYLLFASVFFPFLCLSVSALCYFAVNAAFAFSVYYFETIKKQSKNRHDDWFDGRVMQNFIDEGHSEASVSFLWWKQMPGNHKIEKLIIIRAKISGWSHFFFKFIRSICFEFRWYRVSYKNA